jgi:putative transposase
MRKNRVLKENAEYHVTARINRGEMVFDHEEDKKLFMDVFKTAKRKFSFQIKNFCIMNNHIHLLIKPNRGESLSKIMQWILSVFAMRWNRKYKMTGHVWGERFFSRIILGIIDYLRTFVYIDDNPKMAQIVEYPWQWKYGGLWHHRKGIQDIVDDPEPIVIAFFPSHRKA